jgi:hypothetical protein
VPLRRGAIVASVPLDALNVVQGAEHLSVYRFHTGTAKHHFCSICGIYTHHQRGSKPDEYGFNIRCLEDMDNRSNWSRSR